MFKDRIAAAQQLAEKLMKYAHKEDVVIIAIPRGGLQMGSVLSHKLGVPLDVFFSKKISAPGNPEYAIGAVSIDDQILEPSIIGLEAGGKRYIEEETEKIRQALKERAKLYKKGRSTCDLKDKTVIITDDGVATGKTLALTIDLIKKKGPKKIILAIPVGPKGTIDKLADEVDEVVCLTLPDFFYAISAFYEQFPQVEDEEAIALLQKAQHC